MNARELPNGNLLVPARAEGPNGEIGDGLREIGPDDLAYEVWAAFLARSTDTTQEASDEPRGG